MSEPIDDVARQLEAIREELTQRIARIHSQNRRRILIAGCLVVFFVGYLTWTTQYISRYLTPENMVAAVYGRASLGLPSATEEVARSLQESAPALVTEMLRGVAIAIPQGRQSAQDHFNLLLSEAAEQIGSALATTIPQVFPRHPEAIAMLTRRMGTDEVEAMARDLADTIEMAMEAEGEGLDNDALLQIRDTMWAIHKELDTLRQGGRELTDIQQLEKRFIELAIHLTHGEAS